MDQFEDFVRESESSYSSDSLIAQFNYSSFFCIGYDTLVASVFMFCKFDVDEFQNHSLSHDFTLLNVKLSDSTLVPT